MATTEHVVVGYDASIDADRALEWAVSYAAPRHLRVEVLSCTGDREYLPQRFQHEEERLLGDWEARAEKLLSKGADVDWSLFGSPDKKAVPALVDASQEARIVVVGAQGHSVLGGMAMGSVSQHVARHAACSVAVIRSAHDPTSRRTVVGVDGSPTSQEAVEFAFDLAEEDRSTVVALHGRNLAAVNGLWDTAVAPKVAEELAEVERMLAEALAGARQDHPEVTVELAAVPLPPRRALVDASARASMVVVGHRGRGGFPGLQLGSVGATVLHLGECPVVVVR
jgi:nucleotide-binding universal stress UspA family protein